MNRQELIKQIKKLFVFGLKDYIERDEVLVLVEQLDEPKKPVVPQFVADWIEKCKNKEKSLLNALLYTPEKVNSWVGNSENQETFALAWIFSYKVEKEPKYTVKIKGINGYGQYLNKALSSKEYFFASNNEVSGYRTKHTKKQLEETGFGWVFDCPGIEVEEVAD